MILSKRLWKLCRFSMTCFCPGLRVWAQGVWPKGWRSVAVMVLGELLVAWYVLVPLGMVITWGWFMMGWIPRQPLDGHPTVWWWVAGGPGTLMAVAKPAASPPSLPKTWGRSNTSCMKNLLEALSLWAAWWSDITHFSHGNFEFLRPWFRHHLDFKCRTKDGGTHQKRALMGETNSTPLDQQ